MYPICLDNKLSILLMSYGCYEYDFDIYMIRLDVDGIFVEALKRFYFCEGTLVLFLLRIRLAPLEQMCLVFYSRFKNTEMKR